jgi:hypothetical protein
MEPLIVILFIIVIVVIVLLVRRGQKRKKIREHVVGKEAKIGEVDIPREKSVLVSYVFWMIPTVGQLGGARYYLGKYPTAILYTFTASIVGIGWIIDAFLLPKMTRDTNRKKWEQWFARQSDQWLESSGTVRDFAIMHQTDLAGQAATPKQVMNFRIEETDEQGDISRLIEVELIGNRISGNLRNGDHVTVRGKMSKENILRALSAENKTTNSRVTVSF